MKLSSVSASSIKLIVCFSKLILWMIAARGLLFLRSSLIIRLICCHEMPDDNITDRMSMMAWHSKLYF